MEPDKSIFSIEIDKLNPHPENVKIYQEQYDNTERLEKSIIQHGQLEPVVITSTYTIISGHRRYKVLKQLGFDSIKVRVEDFDNEIEALINFNIQREKRGEEIANEIRYLEKEVYGKIERRGRKKKNTKEERVDKLTDYAKRFDISRTSASTLLQIERNCPNLIKRIKLKGNVDGDLTINKAYQLCFQSPKEKTDKSEINKVKSSLKKVESNELVEVLKNTYPYSLMVSYSSHTDTTTFTFNDTRFNTLNERREALKDNLEFLKKLDARELLIYKKVEEVKNLNIPSRIKDGVFNNLWRPTDITNEEKTIQELNSIKPILKKTGTTDEFNTLRILTHSLEWNQNVGRNLKYIVEDETSGKLLGMITIGSDVVSIGVRDKHIGWTNENKFNQKKLNHTAIATTVAPTQPLGYNFVGTKLIASLLTLKTIQDDWEETYGDKLVGITTTSLFGTKSTYNGINWWKKLGSTEGKMLLHPDTSHYEFFHYWLKENRGDWYNRVITNERIRNAESMGLAENETGPVSGVKQKILSKIYKSCGLRLEDYRHNFRRGVYYLPLYTNTYEFLRDEITENQLEPQPNGVGDYDFILDWWKKKAEKRYRNLIEEDRIIDEPVWYDDISLENVSEWLELRGIQPLMNEE